MNVPEPETKRALLTHARTGEVVCHQYVTSVLGEVPETMYTDEVGVAHLLRGGPVWFHLFESQEDDPSLRAQRTWGCDFSESAGGTP